MESNSTTQLQMPTGWDQITIGQYEKILKHFKNANQDGDYYTAWLKVISVAAGITLEDAQNLFPDEVDQFSVSLEWLANTDAVGFVNDFTIDGVKYVVNPDLNPNNLTGGQYASLLDIKHDSPDNKAALVAVFARPEGNTFEESEYNKLVKLFSDKCPCSVFWGLGNYFKAFGAIMEPHMNAHIKAIIANTQQEVDEINAEYKNEAEQTDQQ